MLSNAYFLAEFRFDTAENEPAKNLQNSAKTLLAARSNLPAARSMAAKRSFKATSDQALAE